MTLAERLSELRPRRLQRHLRPVVRARRRVAEIARLCRQQRLDPGHLGRRPRPGPGRPGGRRRRRPRRRRPAGRDPRAGRPGHARRHGAPGAAQLPPVPRLAPRSSRPSTPQIAAGKQARTFVVILAPVVQIPVELEKQFVVVEHDLPGRDQLGADRPRRRHRAGRAARGRRPGRRARRGGRADPDRGRERLQPLAGPPRPARRRRRSGSSRRGMLKKSGLLTPAPRRRDVRRPGRPGGPQGVLLAGPAAGRPRRRSGPAGVLLLGRPGHGQVSASPRPWATRRAGRRWSSTSAP